MQYNATYAQMSRGREPPTKDKRVCEGIADCYVNAEVTSPMKDKGACEGVADCYVNAEVKPPMKDKGACEGVADCYVNAEVRHNNERPERLRRCCRLLFHR